MKDLLATIALLGACGILVCWSCMRKTHDAQITEYGGDAARAHCLCGWTRVHYGDRAKEDAEQAVREHLQQVGECPGG